MNIQNPGNEMQRELQALLDELCVDLGFCLPPDDQKRIISVPYYDAEGFTSEVFAAEKINTNSHAGLAQKVLQRFTKRFGDSIHIDDYL